MLKKKIKGYKAFLYTATPFTNKKELSCREFKFQPNKTYTHNGRVEVCLSGFHFCTNLADVFEYYSWSNFMDGNVVIHEVVGSGNYSKDISKRCSKLAVEILEIGRRIPKKEIIERFTLTVRKKIVVEIGLDYYTSKFVPKFIRFSDKKTKIHNRMSAHGAYHLFSGKTFTRRQHKKLYEVMATITISPTHTREAQRTKVIRQKVPMNIKITGRPKLIKTK